MDIRRTLLFTLIACGLIVSGLFLFMGHSGGVDSQQTVPAPTGSGMMPAPAEPSPSPQVTAQDGTGSCRPLTITQTDGTEVTFPCQPKRIIAANANAVELLAALGANSSIVGVTDSTFAVPYIKDKIPGAVGIGDWQTPNIEQIMALKPDVVISYSTYRPKNADQLTAQNITIVSLDCYKLSTLASDARALGKLTGTSNTAEVYARNVEDTIAEVSSRTKLIEPDKRPTVYFESYSELTASAPGSGSDELITGAGGENIAAALPASSMKVSPEWVVAQKPDFVFKAVSSTNTRSLPQVIQEIRGRTGWQDIPAVKNDHVYAFSNEILYGPRAYIGLVYTAQILHPKEFRDLHPREMLAQYEKTYVSGTNRTGMIYP